MITTWLIPFNFVTVSFSCRKSALHFPKSCSYSVSALKTKRITKRLRSSLISYSWCARNKLIRKTAWDIFCFVNCFLFSLFIWFESEEVLSAFVSARERGEVWSTARVHRNRTFEDATAREGPSQFAEDQQPTIFR